MHLTEAFSTPIYENMIADERVDREFVEVLKLLHEDNKFGLNLATECQYLSDPTFTENLFDSNKLNTFKIYLEQNVREYIKSVVPSYVTNRTYDFYIDTSWLTLNKKGQYSHMHHHGDADISGVFYVKTNGDDGRIVFENPNRLSTTSYMLNTWQECLYLKPQVNKLVLFPGWLIHRVEKNETDEDRISFSFNIMFNRKKP